MRADAAMKAASVGLSAVVPADGNNRCQLGGLAAVAGPLGHEPGTLLEQVTTSIGGLGLVA